VDIKHDARFDRIHELTQQILVSVTAVNGRLDRVDDRLVQTLALEEARTRKLEDPARSRQP